VRIEALEGEQEGDEQNAFSNNMPSFAKKSKVGV